MIKHKGFIYLSLIFLLNQIKQSQVLFEQYNIRLNHFLF